MKILKPKTGLDECMNQPNAGRRSFIWKAGAAVSAVLATAVPGMAKTVTGGGKGLKSQVDQLSARVGMLEDENAIRSIHKSYENYLDKGMYEEIVNLFAPNGEVVYNGGIFKGRDHGISRLYKENFRAGMTGRKIESAPGLETVQQEIITVSADRKSASASFPFSIQAGAPIISDSQLVQMSRLQGQGIMKWWEGGTCKVSYIKDAQGGWKIKSFEYCTISKMDYRPGKSYAATISIPAFSKTYPEDKTGPDRLVSQA